MGEQIRKGRAEASLPHDLTEEIRDCVVALAGPPNRLTLSGFMETALRLELERRRQQHNEGRAFPARETELRPGRKAR